MPETSLAAELDLASLLRIPVMRLSRRLRAEGADNGLTLSQAAALSTLDRHGPMTPGVLADHERVQPPSITRILSILEERGLVARRPHPTDGRQQVIELTGAGKGLVVENRRRRDAWLSQQLQLVTREELDALRAAIPVLERLGLA